MSGSSKVLMLTELAVLVLAEPPRQDACQVSAGELTEQSTAGQPGAILACSPTRTRLKPRPDAYGWHVVLAPNKERHPIDRATTFTALLMGTDSVTFEMRIVLGRNSPLKSKASRNIPRVPMLGFKHGHR